MHAKKEKETRRKFINFTSNLIIFMGAVIKNFYYYRGLNAREKIITKIRSN